MFGDQLLVTKRFFKRIEIGALDIFDNGNFECRLVIDIAYNEGDLYQASELGSPPTSFAGYDFVAIDSDGTRHDRLNDTMLTDRCCEIMELRFIEVASRVLWIPGDKLDRNHTIGIDRQLARLDGIRLVHFADKSRKATSQASL
jgi:hypothetical protein